MSLLFDTTRTAYLHDYDGVHYRFADHPDPAAFFAACAIQTLRETFSGVSDDDIARIYRFSIQEHGIGHVGFFEIAQQRGISVDEFSGFFSREFHNTVYESMQSNFPQWATKNPQAVRCFRLLKGHVKHGLLTMGDVEVWAEKVLGHKGIIEFFDPNCLLGFEECKRYMKSKSDYPLGLAMEKLEVEPEQTVFVEDSIANLEMAKRAYPDIFTVLVGARHLHSDFDCVDMQVPNLLSFLQESVAVHAPQAGCKLIM